MHPADPPLVLLQVSSTRASSSTAPCSSRGPCADPPLRSPSRRTFGNAVELIIGASLHLSLPVPILLTDLLSFRAQPSSRSSRASSTSSARPCSAASSPTACSSSAAPTSPAASSSTSRGTRSATPSSMSTCSGASLPRPRTSSRTRPRPASSSPSTRAALTLARARSIAVTAIVIPVGFHSFLISEGRQTAALTDDAVLRLSRGISFILLFIYGASSSISVPSRGACTDPAFVAARRLLCVLVFEPSLFRSWRRLLTLPLLLSLCRPHLPALDAQLLVRPGATARPSRPDQQPGRRSSAADRHARLPHAESPELGQLEHVVVVGRPQQRAGRFGA